MNYSNEDKKNPKRLRLAIFLSGTGTNAVNIIEYFKNHKDIEVVALLSNSKESGAERIGKEYNLPYRYFNKEEYQKKGFIVELLKEHQVGLVVLAGFLWLINEDLLSHYANRIINIHPALLPNYGGKGMYGIKVHEKVIEQKDAYSGITIHLVNEKYDNGEVLFQASCNITSKDDATSLAKKIHVLEYQFFPNVIESYAYKCLNL